MIPRLTNLTRTLIEFKEYLTLGPYNPERFLEFFPEGLTIETKSGGDYRIKPDGKLLTLNHRLFLRGAKVDCLGAICPESPAGKEIRKMCENAYRRERAEYFQSLESDPNLLLQERIALRTQIVSYAQKPTETSGLALVLSFTPSSVISRKQPGIFTSAIVGVRPYQSPNLAI